MVFVYEYSVISVYLMTKEKFTIKMKNTNFHSKSFLEYKKCLNDYRLLVKTIKYKLPTVFTVHQYTNTKTSMLYYYY